MSKVLFRIEQGDIAELHTVAQGSVTRMAAAGVAEAVLRAPHNDSTAPGPLADGWHFGSARYARPNWAPIITPAAPSRKGALNLEKEIARWEKRTAGKRFRESAPGVQGNAQRYAAAREQAASRAREAHRIVQILSGAS